MARQSTFSFTQLSPLALVTGAVVALLLAGTIALWARHGTAMFFEMIAAGIATCL